MIYSTQKIFDLENKDTVKNELIIDVRQEDIRIALLKDKQLTELKKESNSHRFSVGDIYLGRVKKLMPGLNAAFVDVGYKRDAFLHYLDLGPNFQTLHKFLNLHTKQKNKRKPTSKVRLEAEINKNGSISDVLSNNQYVLVQVAKEPISQKGPRLSSEISIAGRNMVLMPFSNKVSISQKISGTEEKKRLKKLIESIKPKNYGIIIRTAAQTKKVADLDKELRFLINKWETCFKKIQSNTKPPALLMGEVNQAEAVLRDILNSSFTNVVVNDESSYLELKKYLHEISPQNEDIVTHYKGKTPIFDYFSIEKQIKSLFGKNVTMSNGSYLIIEHTEALHVIDVNSGNISGAKNQEANALQTNLIAVKEIARQLRLRDMGGIIVVDFIDMQHAENRKKLFEEMKAVMKEDRAKHHMLPLSRFGLMEITRQRVRPEMNIHTEEVCPTCQGSGKIQSSILVTDEIKNKLVYHAKKSNVRKILITVHPFIEAFINRGFNSVRKAWQKETGLKIKVQSRSAYSLMEYHFFDQKSEEEILPG